MAHKHSIYDTDPHYVIDPNTKEITTESTKVKLMQYDHNSERFTFEIPRFVDGHDMSLCNKIKVHFNNAAADKTAVNKDAHEVEDMQLAPDDQNMVIFSWLVSQNATQLAGMLSFSICFSCVADDGTVDYAWHTAIYAGITIADGIHNDEAIVERYSDVLEAWRKELFSIGTGKSIGESGEIFNDYENNQALGIYTHAEGYSTTAELDYSHAEGYMSTASGYTSHAEGYSTTASGHRSHAEGSDTTASGGHSHAEGNKTTASGDRSHAEGFATTASGKMSHAEGHSTQAIGDYSHAEGIKTTASGENSHAEGSDTTASGGHSHAEGNKTTASGDRSHAEGDATKASGDRSHAEGDATKASGDRSHAEGMQSVASGGVSHAEGHTTQAKGDYSHAEGLGTIASGKKQHVQGSYNIADTANKYAHIVGGGKSNEDRKNIHTVDWGGNAFYSGSVEASAVILRSATAGSSKKFKLTVDDSGTLTVAEV